MAYSLQDLIADLEISRHEKPSAFDSFLRQNGVGVPRGTYTYRADSPFRPSDIPWTSMHSAGNLELSINLVRASSSRANRNSLCWWESPHGVDSIFFTVEGKRSCLCMEMDTAGMVTALVHLGDS